jgi:hypothetical protein
MRRSSAGGKGRNEPRGCAKPLVRACAHRGVRRHRRRQAGAPLRGRPQLWRDRLDPDLGGHDLGLTHSKSLSPHAVLILVPMLTDSGLAHHGDICARWRCWSMRAWRMRMGWSVSLVGMCLEVSRASRPAYPTRCKVGNRRSDQRDPRPNRCYTQYGRVHKGVAAETLFLPDFCGFQVCRQGHSCRAQRNSFLL